MSKLSDFENPKPRYRVCQKCGKPMARGTEGDYCEKCKNEVIYKEVKEYVLNNNVTELEVSDRFNIPLSKVREWIADGRLEYRND